jgi:hypothetical protein
MQTDMGAWRLFALRIILGVTSAAIIVGGLAAMIAILHMMSRSAG